MKQALAVALILSLSLTVSPTGIQAQATNSLISVAVALQDDQYDIYFTPDQLDNLLAPIALYPDPLLAQVLLAATFPDQIDEAARNVRAYGAGYNIDSADWDVSVKAVAHYPTVLSMMADKIDWTTSVGQAYANQSTDVMEAVQRLREQARSMGNLVTTPQQEIVETDGYIYIYPAQPEYIYVPIYDPAIIFIHRGGFYGRPVLFFSIGFIIGAWLNHDCDWRNHRVFYHGWGHDGPRWIDRSRPRVHIDNIYVNDRYRDVRVNRDIGNRRVNYGALDRYNAIHPKVDYNNVRRERPGAAQRQQPPAPRQQAPVPPQRDNKIIRRNIDPRDPRIDANRGRDRQPDQQQRGNVQVPRQPETRQPQTPPPVPQQRGNVQVPRQPEARQPQTPPPVPQQRGNVQVPRQPEVSRPQTPAPVPQQRGNIQIQRQPDSVFRGNQGSIDSRSASQRGQSSRQQQRTPEVRQQPRAQAPSQPQNRPAQRNDRRPR